MAIVYDINTGHTLLRGDDGVVREIDHKSKTQWKRPELCPSCCGEGEVPWRHTFGKGWEHQTCIRCNGTGKRIPELEKLHARYD